MLTVWTTFRGADKEILKVPSLAAMAKQTVLAERGRVGLLQSRLDLKPNTSSSIMEGLEVGARETQSSWQGPPQTDRKKTCHLQNIEQYLGAVQPHPENSTHCCFNVNVFESL